MRYAKNHLLYGFYEVLAHVPDVAAYVAYARSLMERPYVVCHLFMIGFHACV